MAHGSVTLPVVFPFELQSDEPSCQLESARLLADRIIEVREQMALLLSQPLDVPITTAISFGGVPMGSRGQNSLYLDANHFRLRGDQVMTRHAGPGFILHNHLGEIDCDIKLAGPTPNGRDQAGEFPFPAFVHFYWIWNGTTLASLASLASPGPGDVGPTLPAGWFLGACAGAMATTTSTPGPLNTVLVPADIRGRWTRYRDPVAVPTFGHGVLEVRSLAEAVPVNAVNVLLTATISAQVDDVPGEFWEILSTIVDGRNNYGGALVVNGTSGQGTYVARAAGQIVIQNHARLVKCTATPVFTEVIETRVFVLGFENPNAG